MSNKSNKNLICDFSGLPKIGNSDQIKWKNAIGAVVPYVLDGENDYFTIVDYEVKNGTSYITIEHNKETKIIPTNYIKSGHIISFLRGHRKKRKQYNIGDTVTCNNSVFLILGVSVRLKKNGKKNSSKPYYYVKCQKCGFSYWKSGRTMHVGCKCCHSTEAISGINDIRTTDPWMDAYFSESDKWMMDSYSSGSNRRFYPDCPNCGKLSTKSYTINQVRNYGFSCSCLSDGISYPEKFVGSLLDQLGINYITQATSIHLNFDADNKKYDFYVPEYSCIIETHGRQHYGESTQDKKWRPFEEELINDMNKKDAAISNGIDNYIVLDCKESNMSYIKRSILCSELPAIFNFKESDINWIKCNIDATKNIVKEVCDDFTNHHLSTSELCDKYHISKWAANNYIKKGEEFGWANYDLYALFNHKKIVPIKMTTPNEETFYLKTKEDIRRYFRNNGIPYDMKIINSIIDTNSTYKGYLFQKIIDIEDFKKLIND